MFGRDHNRDQTNLLSSRPILCIKSQQSLQQHESLWICIWKFLGKGHRLLSSHLCQIFPCLVIADLHFNIKAGLKKEKENHNLWRRSNLRRQ